MSNIIPDYLSNKIKLENLTSDKIVHGLPWGIVDRNTIQNIINSYENIPKIAYLFLITDSCDQFHIPNNVRLYRTSLYKSKQHKNEHILPYIWENISDPFVALEKTAKPIV